MYHVGDFILRVKNAYRARKKQVVMPYSNINKQVARLLVKEGFLSGIKENDEKGKKILVADLRYVNRKPVLHDVKLVSKPSVRVYKDLHTIRSDKDRALTSIFSTSSGIMTGKEALKKGVGGELLFKIW